MAQRIAHVYYQLGTLLEAGMPIVRALETVTAGSRGQLRAVLSAVLEDVAAGNTLSEAMGRHRRVFKKFDVTLIQAADISGNLPLSLRLLSDWYDFRRQMGYNIISGMALPVVYIHAAAFIPYLPSMIMGKVTLAQYLKFALEILMLLYIPTAVVLLVMKLTPQTGILRRALDRLVLKIPGLGGGMFNLALSRYCRAFYVLYKSGVPIVESSELSAGLTGNAVVGDMLRPGTESAKAGNMVSEGFSRGLPPEFKDLWHIGEESGQLEDATRRLAQMYADSAQRRIKAFSIVLPRIVYFLVLLVMLYIILQMLRAIGQSYKI